MAIEEHGAGRQLIRFRTWPRTAPAGLAPIPFAVLSAAAALDGAAAACAVLGAVALLFVLRLGRECAAAQSALLTAIDLQRMLGSSEQIAQPAVRSYVERMVMVPFAAQADMAAADAHTRHDSPHDHPLGRRSKPDRSSGERVSIG